MARVARMIGVGLLDPTAARFGRSVSGVDSDAETEPVLDEHLTSPLPSVIPETPQSPQSVGCEARSEGTQVVPSSLSDENLMQDADASFEGEKVDAALNGGRRTLTAAAVVSRAAVMEDVTGGVAVNSVQGRRGGMAVHSGRGRRGGSCGVPASSVRGRGGGRVCSQEAAVSAVVVARVG
jgi:hypothetical protein